MGRDRTLADGICVVADDGTFWTGTFVDCTGPEAEEMCKQMAVDMCPGRTWLSLTENDNVRIARVRLVECEDAK